MDNQRNMCFLVMRMNKKPQIALIYDQKRCIIQIKGQMSKKMIQLSAKIVTLRRDIYVRCVKRIKGTPLMQEL